MTGLVELADHPKRAFQVQTVVFREHTRETSVKLARGEHLFILTDKGIEEAPHSGPEDILIITEHFGCWPVVAVKVRAAHLEKWRAVQLDDCHRMMARVRASIAAQEPRK